MYFRPMDLIYKQQSVSMSTFQFLRTGFNSGSSGCHWAILKPEQEALCLFLLLRLEWLYSPCGPSPLFIFLIYFSTVGRTPWMSDQLIARPLPKLLDWNWPIILLRGLLGAWGSLTCCKFTTQVKQLKVPPVGLVTYTSFTIYFVQTHFNHPKYE
jgi:hypothetical protein